MTHPIFDFPQFLSPKPKIWFDILSLSFQSHQAGPGPEIERVSFHLHGKSPLIAHFLAANRIHFEEPAAVKQVVTRTEVEKYPYPL